MDNPVFFTVIALDQGGPYLTDAGLLGSMRAAADNFARSVLGPVPGQYC